MMGHPRYCKTWAMLQREARRERLLRAAINATGAVCFALAFMAAGGALL